MELDGAAFNDDPQAEARRTINAALSRASWMPGEEDTRTLLDRNGNGVGELYVCPPSWPADHDTPEPDEDENEDEDEEENEAEINAYVQAVPADEFAAIALQIWAEEDHHALTDAMTAEIVETYHNDAIIFLEQRCYAERALRRSRRERLLREQEADDLARLGISFDMGRS